MLDKLVPKRDGDDFRLDAERGGASTITFELDQSRTVFLDMFQLVIPMFQEIGIDAQMRPMDRSLWETRVRQGRDFDATAHQFGANGGIAAMLDARYYVPTDANAIYAPGWQLWYRDRANPDAIEPPTSSRRSSSRSTTSSRNGRTSRQGGGHEADPPGRRRGVLRLRRFGLPPDSYGMVKKNMRNITKTMPNSFGWPTPAPTRPEQFFKA